MKYKTIKDKNIKINKLGFGGWQLGNQNNWDGPDTDHGVMLVKEAFKKGVNFFDTAPNYGDGKSEIIIGEALKDVRDKVIINTKVGHGPDGDYEFTPEGIKKSIDRSLKKLQTDYIDSVILHNPEFYVLEGKSDLFDVLEEQRQMGKILQYGVSIDTLEELKTVLKNPNIKTIEIMFNMIHQEPKYLFDKVKENDILLIIKVPLDSGWLTGKYNADSTFTGIRERWSLETKNTRSEIVDKIKEIVKTGDLVGPALAFIASFDAVTTVIPGIRNTIQLKSNIENINYQLSEGMKFEIEKLYETYIKKQKTPW